MITLIAVVVVMAVSFVAGVLVGRANKTTVTTAINAANQGAADISQAIKPGQRPS